MAMRSLKEAVMNRIDPQDLNREMQSGNVFVLDVRSAEAYDQASEHIPGDVRFSPDAMEQWYRQVPQDRHVVAYCT
jgi:rhodanese-related sulfurtransferase